METPVNKPKQLRIALRNCGMLDPENIAESIVRDAYQALGKVLKEYSPQECINILKQSGLRGRGGAGFHRAQMGNCLQK